MAEEDKKPSIANHEISSLDEDYPRNSIYVKEEKDEDHIELTSKPRITQNTWLNQIVNGFQNVVDTVLWPALKRTASAMGKQMIDIIIWQGNPPGRGSKDNSDLYTQYNSMYDRNSIRYNGGGYDFGRRFVIEDFNTRDEAASTLSWMRRKINADGKVTVGRLYDFIGESGASSTVDFSRAWRNVDDASILRNGMKWSLELPEPR